MKKATKATKKATTPIPTNLDALDALDELVTIGRRLLRRRPGEVRPLAELPIPYRGMPGRLALPELLDQVAALVLPEILDQLPRPDPRPHLV